MDTKTVAENAAPFTKGPWAFIVQEGPRHIELKRRHYPVGVAVENGRGVAIAFGDDDANARLIAASPRLLDALRGMVGLVQLIERDQPDFTSDHRYIEALAAIAKAEARPALQGETR